MAIINAYHKSVIKNATKNESIAQLEYETTSWLQG
jgi:hypothetical protein